ncbi:hypothetical protein [Tumebacillus permanentifrigoris]|uniref:Uncharacterized protein n=1 Tax=Tumebacillus permanentifrigoris TaxID=378543 RepID=A0A316E0P1_9BACL|nr:hypothetical protein [Tumebacillus permanentifrigoris]PWK16380.1 hypothetical protein C7459_101244 [Tumebacillus permanentifrigoris]
MAGNKKKGRKQLEKRVRTLQACLTTLDLKQPTYETTKRILESEIKLAKAELKTAPKHKPTAKKSTSGKLNNSKRVPLPGGASFPSFQLPSPKSPTFAEDSIKHLSTLRQLCKKYTGYMSRADQLFDSLHGVGSHLHKEGVLPKVIGGKFKDMTTSEWTTLLMALMNSPLAGMFLSTAGGGDAKKSSEHKQEDEKKADGQ